MKESKNKKEFGKKININDESSLFINKEIIVEDKIYETKNKNDSHFKPISLIICIFIILNIFPNSSNYSFSKIHQFVKDCNELKRYNISRWDSRIQNIYISICLPVYNMEKYIERALITILNQSFQNFEIIVVNDASTDNTINIINQTKKDDNRIIIINHTQKMGVYTSRLDAAKIARGEYILYMDPDDQLLNPDLLKEFFYYNLKSDIDIFEFSVYHQKEIHQKIFIPSHQDLSHIHQYSKEIYYQPELSELLFYKPNTKKYTPVHCRTLWNKFVRRTVILKAMDYINKDFYGSFLVTADDTPMNILSFQFAQNYTWKNIPGYLYNVRKNSMSRIQRGKEHAILVCYNYLLYFKLLLRYFTEFKKDLNFLYYDMKDHENYIYKLKDYKADEYLKNADKFFKDILALDISDKFRKYIQNLMHDLNE